MAGSAPVEEAPKLGRAATITGFLFVLLILTGFSAATAVSFEDSVSKIHAEDDHGDDDHAGDDHGDDDHADDDHAEDDHAEDDDHGDE